MINIEFEFTDENKFDHLISAVAKMDFVGAEAELGDLAEKTCERMKETIDSSRKRPDLGTHKLENSIDWSTLINDPGRQLIIGIGEIAKMTAEAPYWEVLDVGGYVPPANYGYFGQGEAPVAGGAGETWTHTGDKKDFYMKPTKAIQGINYIGSALANLNKDLTDIVAKAVGKIFEQIEKA